MDKGVLERVFAELQRGKLETQLEQRESDRPLRMSIDGTIVKVHQDGTGALSNRGRQTIADLRGRYLSDATPLLAGFRGVVLSAVNTDAREPLSPCTTEWWIASLMPFELRRVRLANGLATSCSGG